MNCKLCRYVECGSAGANGESSFYYCPQCGLIFVSPAEYVSFDLEKMRYCHHDNSASSKGNVSYLTGVARFIDDIPIENPDILDFGSGDEEAVHPSAGEINNGAGDGGPGFKILALIQATAGAGEIVGVGLLVGENVGVAH